MTPFEAYLVLATLVSLFLAATAVLEHRRPEFTENLGDGWTLTALNAGDEGWTAIADHRSGGFITETAETPAAAYLALRDAIETGS
jgi:hypothetical protein